MRTRIASVKPGGLLGTWYWTGYTFGCGRPFLFPDFDESEVGAEMEKARVYLKTRNYDDIADVIATNDVPFQSPTYGGALGLSGKYYPVSRCDGGN